MATHNLIGKIGEQLATSHLEKEGYRILHRNWRCGHKELDIVAQKDGALVFVEVKTRKNSDFGNPEDAVNHAKIRRIVSSADAYIRKYRIDAPVRFDLIAITNIEGEMHLEHIEDAFYPPLF